MSGRSIIVNKPPPKRNVVKAITIRVKVEADGLEVEILRNQRLIENDIDEACFLTFFDILVFPVAYGNSFAQTSIRGFSLISLKYSFQGIFKPFLQKGYVRAALP